MDLQKKVLFFMVSNISLNNSIGQNSYIEKGTALVNAFENSNVILKNIQFINCQISSF